MNKKGFFFSVIAIALMILLVTFASLLTQENDFTKRYVAERSTAFLQDELVTNVLELLNVSSPNITFAGGSTVAFVFDDFSDLTDRSSNVDTYISYMEGNYSSLTNTYLTASDDFTTLRIHPHNASVVFDTVTTMTADNLSALTINIHTNYSTGDVLLTAGPSTDGSGDLITVVFHVTDDASYTFAPTLANEINSEFRINFLGAGVSVNYSSEQLTINATNVDVTLEDVILTFDRLAPTKVVLGNITVDSIEQQIIIFKE
jgi:hypothetical protein